MRRQKRMMQDARDVIKALGGPTAVSQWLGLEQGTISNWAGRGGTIARGYRIHVYLSLRERGFKDAEIPPAAFGLKSWDLVIMPRLRKSKPRKAA